MTNIIDPYQGWGAGDTGGGGWISGPSTTTPHRDLPHVDPPSAADDEAQDQRPAYNPDLIVRGVIALLADEGIDLELTGGQRRLAAVQATKLLTTLGVRAAPAPERGRRTVVREP